MSLPLTWIDRIFDKLALVYGRDFLDRWAGIPISQVKTDWCHELSGFESHPEAIKHALQTLPADRPPTVFQFRDAASKAPKIAALTLPLPPADPVFVKKLVAELSKPSSFGKKDWAKAFKSRHDLGEKLSSNQIRCYRLALGMPA